MTKSIKFYDKDYDCNFKYAVIAAFYKGKYVFVRHKDRTTLEIPGGKCEQGETIEQTARRELYEETGAEEFTLTPVCIYKLNNYGMVYYAEITVLGKKPESEIAEVQLMDNCPDNWTYPFAHPMIMKKVLQSINDRQTTERKVKDAEE